VAALLAGLNGFGDRIPGRYFHAENASLRFHLIADGRPDKFFRIRNSNHMIDRNHSVKKGKGFNYAFQNIFGFILGLQVSIRFHRQNLPPCHTSFADIIPTIPIVHHETKKTACQPKSAQSLEILEKLAEETFE
jgi:hypothetical protein